MANEIKCPLIVGMNSTNQDLLESFVKRLGYCVLRADSLEDLDEALVEPAKIKFALLDITGFGTQVWEKCTHLHELDIPLLVISPKQSEEVRRLSILYGVQALLEKPLVMKELAITIHGLMQ